MSTLVTGGFGLIGSEFKGDQYVKVSSKIADLRDIDQINLLFNIHEPEGVIHCAAKLEYIYKINI